MLAGFQESNIVEGQMGLLRVQFASAIYHYFVVLVWRKGNNNEG
jgi:hypothetical protein